MLYVKNKLTLNFKMNNLKLMFNNVKSVRHLQNKTRNRYSPQLLINIDKFYYNNVTITTKVFAQFKQRFGVPLNYFKRNFSTNLDEGNLLDHVVFEKVCDETLDSLCEYFEELVENATHLKAADVSYGVRNLFFFVFCLKLDVK